MAENENIPTEELDRLNDAVRVILDHIYDVPTEGEFAGILNNNLAHELINHRGDVPGCALAAMMLGACYMGAKAYHPDAPWLNLRPRIVEALEEFQQHFQTEEGQERLEEYQRLDLTLSAYELLNTPPEGGEQ